MRPAKSTHGPASPDRQSHPQSRSSRAFVARALAFSRACFRSGLHLPDAAKRQGMATTLTPDLCVIGAGACGLSVATAARRLGASVVVADRGATGAMRPKTGALALSALSEAARRASLMTTPDRFGIA